MANVISFEDALKGSGEKPRSLLLANGFSIKGTSNNDDFVVGSPAAVA
jgi:hypothetical protein